MVILLIVCLVMIAIMSFITGYFTLKAYEKGLTHNYELKHDMKPTEVKKVEKESNPINDMQIDNQVIDEWLNGPKEVKK